MYKHTLLFILALLFSKDLKPQKHQDLQLFVYNVSFNGVTAGIGSMINKPKNTKWHTAFLQGLYKGSIGGVMIYAGKKATYLINKERNYGYGWPAKFLHSVGLSITENGALAKPILANYHVNIGLTRLDIDLTAKPRFHLRLLPFSAYTMYWGFKYGKRLDFKKTIMVGEIVFSNPYSFFVGPAKRQSEALSLGGCIVLGKEYGSGRHYSVSHEMVHQLQFREYMIFNTWFNKLGTKLNNAKIPKLLKKHVYPDLPYNWLFILAEGRHPPPGYFKNFYEFEAERFSTGKHVSR